MGKNINSELLQLQLRTKFNTLVDFSDLISGIYVVAFKNSTNYKYRFCAVL